MEKGNIAEAMSEAKLEDAMLRTVTRFIEMELKGYTASLKIDGELVELDWDNVEVCHHDQCITFKLKSPLYFSDINKHGYIQLETPAQMAG